MMSRDFHSEDLVMIRSDKTSRRGFTMVEMLVLLALVVVLAGVLLPALLRADERADRITCQNNLKQILLAMHNCNDMHGKLPPTVGSFPGAISDGTVQFYLLPFLEEEKLFNDAADGSGGFSVWVNSTYSKKVPVFICPADSSGGDDHMFNDWLATSNYAANYLVFALGGASFPRSFPDGTSNTIAFAERFQICNQTPCAWAYSGESEWAPMFGYSSLGKFQLMPEQARCNPALPQGLHSGGIEVGMGDGSVRFVDSAITPQTWWCAVCPNDGLPLGSDW